MALQIREKAGYLVWGITVLTGQAELGWLGRYYRRSGFVLQSPALGVSCGARMLIMWFQKAPPGKRVEDQWRKKEQAHHSAVRKSFLHLILDFQGLRCKLFMQLHPMLKLVIHNLQRLTSKQSSIQICFCKKEIYQQHLYFPQSHSLQTCRLTRYLFAVMQCFAPHFKHQNPPGSWGFFLFRYYKITEK